MLNDMIEDLRDQREKLPRQAQDAIQLLAGLEAEEVKIISHKAILPAAEMAIVIRNFLEHLCAEIDTETEAIALIDHQLEYLDGDERYEAFAGSAAYKRLTRLLRDSG
jgi:hypothetical protein